MRVSDASMYESVRKQVLRAKQDVTVAQDRLSSGLKVQRASDDPVAAAAARRESSRKSLAEAGMKNAEHATMQLEGADTALGDVYDGLARARELAVSGATSTLGDENRRALGAEVRKIREQMVALGNTNVGGRYIFAGFRDEKPAFESSGAFVGDDSTKEVQAMPGLKVAASVPGSVVFGSGSANDVFATLDKLTTALEGNDLDGVRSTLTDLDVNQERVSDARSQVGSLLGGLQMARSVAERHADRANAEISRLLSVDEISAATDLVRAKGALDQALAVAQQIPTGLAGGK